MPSRSQKTPMSRVELSTVRCTRVKSWERGFTRLQMPPCCGPGFSMVCRTSCSSAAYTSGPLSAFAQRHSESQTAATSSQVSARARSSNAAWHINDQHDAIA